MKDCVKKTDFRTCGSDIEARVVSTSEINKDENDSSDDQSVKY